MLTINAAGGAELVPLGALIGLQWPGRGFWTRPKGPFGTMNGDVPRCGECHCLDQWSMMHEERQSSTMIRHGMGRILRVTLGATGWSQDDM